MRSSVGIRVMLAVYAALIGIVFTVVSGCGGGNSNPVGTSGGIAQSVATVPATTVSFEGGGAEPETAAELASMPQALDAEALIPPGAARIASATSTATPTSAFVPYDNYPPVGDQGQAGSCIAWSYAYEFAGAVVNRATPTANLTPVSQINPLYMYAYAIGAEGVTCGGGTRGSTYIGFLEDSGAWTNVQTPLYPSGGTTDQTCALVSQIQAASPSPTPNSAFEIPAGCTVSLGTGLPPSPSPGASPTTDVVANVKRYLASPPGGTGLPAAMAINEPLGLHGYVGPGSLVAEYFGRNATTCGLEGHGMLVVGYDDSITPNATVTSPAPTCSGTTLPPDWTPSPSPGAFLVQNSWGTKFGVTYPGPTSGQSRPVTGGFVWFSYDTYVHILQSAIGFQPPPDDSHAIQMTGSGAIVAKLVAIYQYARKNDRVYLIFPYTISQNVHLDRFVVTTPEGQTLTNTYNRRIRKGYLHLSRTDGRQWTAGDYTLALQFTTADGRALTASATATVKALNNGLQAAPPNPQRLLGTNGAPLQ